VDGGVARIHGERGTTAGWLHGPPCDSASGIPPRVFMIDLVLYRMVPVVPGRVCVMRTCWAISAGEKPLERSAPRQEARPGHRWRPFAFCDSHQPSRST